MESSLCTFDGSKFIDAKPSGAEEKIYDELKSSVVKIEHGSSYGTGFILDDQGHVATDVHVALNGHRLQVPTANGTLEARIEKLNLIDDIAILSVPGLRELGYKPVQFASDESTEGNKLYSLGFPHAVSSELPCISSGQATASMQIMDVYRKNFGNPEFLTNLDLFPLAQGTPKVPQFLLDNHDNYSQRAESIQGIIVENNVSHDQGNGTSGGPVSDQFARIVGMNDAIQKDHLLIATPASKIIDTLRGASPLRFDYENGKLKSIEALSASNREAVADALLANLILSDSSVEQ